jgi:opacity protein-like surface antigen
MKSILAIAAVAAALIAPISAADAHSSRHHLQGHDGYARVWSAPVARYQNRGPRWSQPNECYTDLGYGRFESCDQ